jgi:hypothetical protein
MVSNEYMKLGIANFFHNSIVSLLAIAYIFFAPFDAFGLGLCQGEDGHVAYEFVYSGKCCPPVIEKASHLVPELDAEHCGTCVDTPVAEEARLGSERTVSLESAVLFFASWTSSLFHLNGLFSNAQKCPQNISFGQTQLPASDFLFQEKIVLLI